MRDKFFKKYVTLFLFLTLNIFLFGEAKTIKVGWYIQDKYQEISESGVPFGYCYDVLQELTKHSDIKYVFIYDSFNECLSMLDSGEVDILGCIIKTPDRELLYSFPDFSIGVSNRYIYTKVDSPLTLENYQEAKDLKIAVLENSYNLEAYKKFVNQDSNEYTLIECENTEVMSRMLQDDYVDVVISGSLPNFNVKILANFEPQPFYFIVSKESPEVLDILNQALSSLKYSNPEFLTKLAKKYGVNSDNQYSLTQNEKNLVRRINTLNVAWSPIWSPLEIKGDDNNFTGYVRHIFNEIEDYTGLNFNYIECKNTSEALSLLNEGKIDIISLYNDANTSTNSMIHILSEPIISLPIQIIKKENSSNSSNKVGVIHSAKSYSSLPGIYEYDLVHYDTIEQALNAVKNEEINFIITNSYTSHYFLQKSLYSDLYSIALQGNPIDLRLAISKNQPEEMVNILNKAISSIPDSTRNSLIIESTIISQKSDNNFINFILNIPTAFLIFILVLFFLFTTIVTLLLIKKTRYTKYISTKLFTDTLTGLLSKDGFDWLVSKRLEKSTCDSYCIISFDIDHFQHYNALFGFETGDKLLINIGKVFTKFCPRDELCAHLDSDHFVLFANEKDLSAEQRIEQLKIDIQKLSHNYKIYFNFGVYKLSNGIFESAKMRDYAKAALRSIKGDTTKHVGYYNQNLHEQLIKESIISSEMEKALANREFIAFFQPKYGCSSEKPVGAEALVRWRKDNGEIIPPGDFISLFEKNGFILKLDMYIFEEACKVLAKQISCGIPPVPISTNFSRIHMYNHNFAKDLAEIAGKYNIPPHLLEIEITESAFITNQIILLQLIENLHSYGFLVSIDDFGSGYSSLNLIKEIRFDVIKIDQIFFRQNKEQNRTKSIIQCILTLAKELGMRTVAEGVETEEQFKFLRENKCDTIQGFYFSKPLEESIFTQLLTSSDSVDT